MTGARLALDTRIMQNVPNDLILNANDAIGRVIEYLPRDIIPEPPENLVDELFKDAKKLEKEGYEEKKSK